MILIAAPLETEPYLRPEHQATPFDWPLAIDVSQLPEDLFIRGQAERFITVARNAGALAVESAVESPEIVEPDRPNHSLLEAIHNAAEGDDSARHMVRTNVLTDLQERGFKAGHEIQVVMDVDADGKLRQHNQTLMDVYRNALKFAAANPAMRARIEAETLNGFRLQSLYNQGWLKDYHLLIISPFPDDMSDDVAAKIGFFQNTKTGVLQLIGEASTGEVIQQSAFVAGVTTPHADRHDLHTIRQIGDRFGVPLAGKNAAEIIATPLLIHKSLLPRGVIDVVQLYDEAAGGTFFGVDRPREDYGLYRELCRARERQLMPNAELVTAQLIAEASELTTPTAAVRRLHELSQQALVSEAIVNEDIDPLVFGETAANYITDARELLMQGRYEEVLEAQYSAQATARSYSCPAGTSSEEEAGSEGSASASKEAAGECSFVSKECPICHKKNVLTTITATEIKGTCGCKVRR